MKPAKSKQLRKGAAKSKSGSVHQDPVEVFCRIRPFRGSSDACLQVISPTTVQFAPPESTQNARGPIKELQYTFKQVFDDSVQQPEVFQAVGKSLVSQLVAGRNGLLFAYGVTGSGKTYTMTGEPQNPGIMPRCLDLLFNTVNENQTSRCKFKPDRMNGFEILDEDEAAAAARNEFRSQIAALKTPKTPRRRDCEGDGYFFSRISTAEKVDTMDEENMYSVFITYIEVYNNCVYDLLDPVEETSRRLQNKVVREDANRNMYVHGVTEIEVKSSEEAYEAFQRGQRRKRIAHTMLNEESSRSHAVFTIRLVQAPAEGQCDSPLQRKLLTISQLSLVDLAGSERTNRTKATGQRLREAGSINNSLMTLRSCLEILRENQQTGSTKMVPYRDSRLTQLFKNYFDGEGHVRMIVCVNPRVEDADETAHVLKFAEMTQEVTVARPTPLRLDVGLTPGRRRAGIFRRMDEDVVTPRPLHFPVAFTPVSSKPECGGLWPRLELTGPSDEVTLAELRAFLEKMGGGDGFAEWQQAEETFRCELVRAMSQLKSQSCDLSAVQTLLDQERRKVEDNETKLSVLSVERSELLQKLQDRDELIRCLQQKIEEKDMVINQQVLEKGKVKEKCNYKIAQNKEKLKREAKMKMLKQKEELEMEMREKEEKIRAMRNVLDDIPSNRHVTPRILTRSRTRDGISTPAAAETPGSSKINAQGTLYQAAVINPRHRRSRSAGGGDRWLDHQPMTPVPLSTIFQPTMRKRKSVTKLTDLRDVVNSKTSKYCLTTQEADTDGELETKLYKGDVIPTATGGAQVILNDVEMLKQMSPQNVTVRKRSWTAEDVSAKCSMAIEGHNKKMRN